MEQPEQSEIKKRKLGSFIFFVRQTPLKIPSKVIFSSQDILKTLLFLTQTTDYMNDERLHLIFIQSPLHA